MSEVSEGTTRAELHKENTPPMRNLIQEILVGPTPKRTSLAGGEWNAGKRTYTIKDTKIGILTTYKLVHMGNQMQSGNAENVVIEHYKESVSTDGKPVRSEVVVDQKSGEWRKPTIVDKIMKYTETLHTTGHVTEVRHADNSIDHRLEIVEHDAIVQQPPPTIIYR